MQGMKEPLSKSGRILFCRKGIAPDSSVSFSVPPVARIRSHDARTGNLE